MMSGSLHNIPSLPCVLRIHRAGYPIRHDFAVFVERYRVLQPGLKMTDVTDFKYSARVLCNRVLGEAHDWQIGRTKVFLKVREVHFFFFKSCSNTLTFWYADSTQG